jgi:serine/threonine protein kinase/tetratricopeptide (TPR) repeat protein
MTPERWQQIKAVFATALALDPDRRAEYLAQACAGDDELRGEVESLLDSSPREGDHFLDTPAVRLPADAFASPSTTGRRVGPYELVGELGRGGMGEVYRARRADGQYEQQVAVKLIRGGFEERRALLERFRTERQILATLEHPNIARLLDGGASEDGRPYLVMELIEGVDICAYSDASRLNISARLELFLQVCSAVEYAHQRLIVHRDIKPRNILVTPQGVPKLLDFGVAKILADSGDNEATLNRPMTLAYASPEQIRGEPVTTASDVYSLGVVLYQLLSGHSPYRRDTRTPGGLYRAIDEDEPTRPSAAVARPAVMQIDGRDVEVAAASLGATREGTLSRLAKRLGGDLDHVVLKALRKEPGQRYASVAQFADDIQRHLHGFPVSARQGTWSYHAQKFVRRHKAGMATAALVGIATIVGVVATMREARIAAANARRAEQRFEQVRKLANAMVFDVHDAIEPLPGATKPRALIVRLGLEYLDELSRDPSADGTLQLQIALGYLRLGHAQSDPNESNLGDRVGGAASYRKAIEILDRLHVRDPGNREVTARLTEGLNGLAQVIDSSTERESLVSRALALRRADAEAHRDDLGAQRRYASSLFNVGLSNIDGRRYPEATAAFEQALEIFLAIDRRAATRDSARNVALCDKRLAALSLRAGNVDEALQGYQRALEIDERLAAQDPRDKTAASDLTYDLSDLGTTLRRLNRYAEAGAAYSRAIAMRRIAYTEDANDVRARRGLASSLYRQGELLLFDEKQPGPARVLLREAAQLWSQQLPQVDPERGDLEYDLGYACQRLGDPREAQAHNAAALAIFDAAARRAPLLQYQQHRLEELRARGGGPATSGRSPR